MDVLITGGCGFIGSNFIKFILEKREDVTVINLDKLTYAGNPASLSGVSEKYSHRYQFIKGDICDKEVVFNVFNNLFCFQR